MKTTYRRKSKLQRRSRRLFFVVALVLALTAALVLTGRSTLGVVAAPIRSSASSVWAARDFILVRFQGGLSVLRSKVSLTLENRSLRARNRELEARLLVHDSLLREKRRLEEALGRGQRADEFIFARVLAKPARTPYDTLVLDVGSDDTVAVGDGVIIGDGIPIGTIIETARRTSKASLYSSFGSEVDVLLGEEALQFRAEGLGAGTLKVDVPRDVDVGEGDEVFLVQGGRRLSFGVIAARRGRAADPTKTLVFQSPVSVAELAHVFVVTENSP